MNILVCPDKFKGSLTAKEVCEVIEGAIGSILPNATIRTIPLADGGEGTCDVLTDLHGGRRVRVKVRGPLFVPMMAQYGISQDGTTAFIEMAEASGLMLLRPDERNPLLTTSTGTGDLIVDALDHGVSRIILGIGGSATNDAGIGMASALGYVFYDEARRILKPTGEALIHLRFIDTVRVHPRLKSTKITTLCDVANPLSGPDGAAYIYGPQKGADQATVERLDAGLQNFRTIVHRQLNKSVDFPGAGAAGGLGAGARVFLNSEIKKGASYLIENWRFSDHIRDADVIITGEGKIDSQTLSGKVVSEIIRLSVQAGKPVYAVCGVCDLSQEETTSLGLRHVISLVDEETPPDVAIRDARAQITRKIQQLLTTRWAF